jgi:transposase
VAMAATAQSAIAVIGIDIGKNSFHIVGLDGRGAIVLRQKAIFSRLPGNALPYCT